MKRVLFLAVLLFAGASFAAAQVETMEQNRNRIQSMEQNKIQIQNQFRYVDKDGNGLNHNMFQHRYTWMYRVKNNGFGPGDGTGNQGSGPRDGSGYGPAHGYGSGSGECNGTGPKGSTARRGKGGR